MRSMGVYSPTLHFKAAAEPPLKQAVSQVVFRSSDGAKKQYLKRLLHTKRFFEAFKTML